MKDTKLSKLKQQISKKIKNIPKRKVKQLILILAIFIVLDLIKMNDSHIVKIRDHIFTDFLEWIAYIEKKYEGASGFLGNIIGVMGAVAVFSLESIREKKNKEKQEKRILALSILGVYECAYRLSSNKVSSDEYKKQKLGLYLDYVHDDDTMKLLNYYIKDYKLKLRIEEWVVDLYMTPMEAIHPGKVEHYREDIEEVIKCLGYFEHLEKMLPCHKNKNTRTSNTQNLEGSVG